MKLGKKALLMLGAVWFPLTGAAAAPAAELPVVRVAVVQDGPWSRFSGALEILQREVVVVSQGEFDVRFPESMIVDGAWSRDGINRRLDEVLADPDVDLVIALGHVASNEAARRRDLVKPVIAPLVVDALAQNFPAQDGACGVTNLCYVDALKSIRREIRMFRQMVPLRHLALVVDRLTLDAIPETRQAAERAARAEGIELTIVPAEIDAGEVLAALPDAADGVMLTALLRFTEGEFDTLVERLIDLQLPSYSFWGRDEVERGVLASVTPEGTLEHVSRSIGVHILGILRGEDPATLGVVFSAGEQVTINMATARAIDYYPSLSLLTEADLLHEQITDAGWVLSLETAVREAEKSNLELLASRRGVVAGAERVREVRSGLLPQVGLSTDATVVDDDRARAANGNLPEKTWNLSGTARQQIYSDRLWRDYAVERHLQSSREELDEDVRLRVVQEAATAYLRVLRDTTVERIRKTNLKLTRANLERARVRNAVGIAGPDEVYRWESQLAQDRRDVLAAEAATLSARENLNRVLHKPLDEVFVARETSLQDPLLQLVDSLFVDMAQNPRRLKLYREFMIQQGMDLAPTLKALDAAIDARKRIVTGTTRDLWLPDLGVQGSADWLLAEGGDGQRADAVFDRDATDWSVSVVASIPLFTSGRKVSARARALEELAQLRIERAAAAEFLEQSISRAVNRTRASYPGIGLTRDAAAAARENLALVADSYERGIKSIIDLIDAQRVSVNAELEAANAPHEFLVDLVELQRAVGHFELFLGAEEREAWYARLGQYFADRGEQP